MGGDTCHWTPTSHGKSTRYRSISELRTPSIQHPTFRNLKSEADLNRSHEEVHLKTTVPDIIAKPRQHSSMQDDNINLNTSECDHKALKEVLRKVSNLRERLYGMRLQLKEKRNELRQKRLSLGETDATLMKYVRHFQEPSNFRKFAFDERLYTELELQRDVVGSLQYDYDQAEDEYDMAEIELENEEVKLKLMFSDLVGKESDYEDHSMSASLGGHERPEEIMPPNEDDEAELRIAEFQSRVGDARIMQERLQDLLSEKWERRGNVKKMAAFNLKPAMSDREFSEDFDYQYSKIVTELKIIEADVEQLKTGLIEAGYWMPEMRPRNRPEEGLTTESHPQKSYDLSPAVGQRPVSDGVLNDLQNNFAAARARISRWLLITFGSSPVEHARHKEIIRALGDRSMDDKEWARLVFEYWKKDEFDDDSSWDEIFPHDLLEPTPDNKLNRTRNSILLSGKLEATNAMSDFQQQFPLSKKDHATPYAKDLEADVLSVYESRSI